MQPGVDRHVQAVLDTWRDRRDDAGLVGGAASQVGGVTVGLILTVGWGIGVAARAGWRGLRAPRIVQMVNAALILGGAGVSLLAAVAAVHMLRQATPEIDATVRALWLAQCGLVGLMAAGVAASGLRARRLARQVTRAVLAAVPDAAALTTVLASCIGDPQLALVFPREGGAVDADGRPTTPAGPSAAVVRVTRSDARWPKSGTAPR